MKRRMSILSMILALVLMLSACGTSTEAPAATTQEPAAVETPVESTDPAPAEPPQWEGGNVTLVASGSAGGGLDGLARLVAPYLQEALPEGTTVVVENLPGGNGWISWNSMMEKDPDGLTITTMYTPQCFSYLNPELAINSTIDSFTLLCNMVFDPVTICVAAEDERFADVNTLQEFADYLKAHEDETFTVANTLIDGGDHLAMLDFCNQAGVTNLKETYYSNISDAAAAFMGRHVDIYFGKVGDTLNMYNEGSAKVLAVCKAERSNYMPDVPTAAEQGYNVVNGSARGWCIHPDTPDYIVDALLTAMDTVFNDPAFQESMNAAGYDTYYVAGDDYTNFMLDQEAIVKGFLPLLGWDK